jgi:hypothetical protein
MVKQYGYYIFAEGRRSAFDVETEKGGAFIGDLSAVNFHRLVDIMKRRYKGVCKITYFYMVTFRNEHSVEDEMKYYKVRLNNPTCPYLPDSQKADAVKLSLLLRDSISMPYEITEPLSLAIDTANEIREAAGNPDGNVPNVFQAASNVQNKMSEPPHVATPPEAVTLEMADSTCKQKKRKQSDIKIMIEAAVDTYGTEQADKFYAEQAKMKPSMIAREPYATFLTEAKEKYRKQKQFEKQTKKSYNDNWGTSDTKLTGN